MACLGSLGDFLTLGVYFAVGVAAYGYWEGWQPFDSVYFLVVTMTTVGYGDFVPVTVEGRLFTSVYALLGITLGFRALIPIAERLLLVLDHIEAKVNGVLERLKIIAPQVDMESVDALAANAAKINYFRAYLVALWGPMLVLVIGVFLAQAVEQLSWADALYWTIITMSTIGYGDIVPTSTASKVGIAIFLPLAVVSLANGVTRVQMVRLRKQIRETDQAKIADKLLLQECRGNPNETLTEAEFLVTVLKENNIVDELTLATIRAEFRELVAHGSGAYELRVLDSRAVFLQLVADGRIANRGMKPPGTRDGQVALVDTSAFDKGYKEWRKHHWEKQVAKAAPKQAAGVRAKPANEWMPALWKNMTRGTAASGQLV